MRAQEGVPVDGPAPESKEGSCQMVRQSLEFGLRAVCPCLRPSAKPCFPCPKCVTGAMGVPVASFC